MIATIFPPLTFVTGFFGQNFGWMVGHIASWRVFVGLGIGTEIATVAFLIAFFKRRGWFFSPKSFRTAALWSRSASAPPGHVRMRRYGPRRHASHHRALRGDLYRPP